MSNKKEISAIILAIIIMTLILSFSNGILYTEKLLESLAISAVIILFSVFCKKAIAKKIDTKINLEIWGLQRFWISRRAALKKPAPMGLILPLLLAFLSGGFIKFLTLMQFTIEALPSKSAKKYGRHRFSNISDWDNGLIAFYSMIGLVLLSLITSFFEYSILIQISRWSFFYAAYGLVPFGNLDGLKLFFASRPLYIFSLVLMAVLGAIILI